MLFGRKSYISCWSKISSRIVWIFFCRVAESSFMPKGPSLAQHPPPLISAEASTHQPPSSSPMFSAKASTHHPPSSVGDERGGRDLDVSGSNPTPGALRLSGLQMNEAAEILRILACMPVDVIAAMAVLEQPLPLADVRRKMEGK
ncbi:unnamed protein product [Cuscuta campestris]|uniref:Uncharacterized protein n=1 Tax=Cuscuta campestris TaxID=132261 RepID=A0A484KP06_9ASTE|nr:unnamed protein product [Cuscuta campestris]